MRQSAAGGLRVMRAAGRRPAACGPRFKRTCLQFGSSLSHLGQTACISWSKVDARVESGWLRRGFSKSWKRHQQVARLANITTPDAPTTNRDGPFSAKVGFERIAIGHWLRRQIVRRTHRLRWPMFGQVPRLTCLIEGHKLVLRPGKNGTQKPTTQTLMPPPCQPAS